MVTDHNGEYSPPSRPAWTKDSLCEEARIQQWNSYGFNLYNKQTNLK